MRLEYDEYFMCVKKKTKTNSCRRPAIRLERIENGIARFYARFQISEEKVKQIRATVVGELAAQQAEAEAGVKRATRRKARLEDERHKLLQAHYAGAIPQDLLAEEMKRLTRGLTEAEAEISSARTTTRELENTLSQALQAAGHCQAAYQEARPHIRRQINQGFFTKLFIDEDGSVERYELTEPFAVLLGTGQTILAEAPTAEASDAHHMPEPSQIAPDGRTAGEAEETNGRRSTPSQVFMGTFGNDGNKIQKQTTPGA
ncbi:MAG: hypothetical protein ACRDQW_02670 [Haloechinothrix sp.]